MMPLLPYFGPFPAPFQPRALELVTLRFGQRARLRRAIVDLYPQNPWHQALLGTDAEVQITSLAGHSGPFARYQIKTLDERGKRISFWKLVMEPDLEPSPNRLLLRVCKSLAVVLPTAALALALAACASPGGNVPPIDSPSATQNASADPAPGATGRSALELAGPTGAIEQATVLEVVDGDTIHVRLSDGTSATVRYIGVDTPETVHPSKPVQPFGPEASAANRQLVAGAVVTLEVDLSDSDRYDRLLRYVWLGSDGDWLLVNAELLRRGLATVSTYPPDVKWVEPIYLSAQRAAAEVGLGIWSTPTPLPLSSAAPAQTPDGSPRGDCHPDYSACLPIGTDVNCDQIADRNFRSTGDDPYELDGNGDGVACSE